MAQPITEAECDELHAQIKDLQRREGLLDMPLGEPADPQIAAAKERYRTRQEALRLAVEASPKSGSWREVLNVAREFEAYLNGMVEFKDSMERRAGEREAQRQAMSQGPYKHDRTAVSGVTCGDWMS